MPISLMHNGKEFNGYQVPLIFTWLVILNSVPKDHLSFGEDGWAMNINEDLAAFLSDYLTAWIQCYLLM